MYIIIDAVLILLLTLFLYSGYKQGFIKAGIGFLCFAVSIVLAYFLSPIISTYVYDHFIFQRLVSDINKAISKDPIDVVGKTVTIIESLPKFITGAFENYGISKTDISSLLIKGNDPAVEISNLIRPIINNLLYPIVLIITTTILTFLSNIILRKVKKVSKNVFIGKVDAALGLAFGGLKYAVLLFIVSLCLKTVIPLWSTNMSEKINTEIEKTTLAKYSVNMDFDIFNAFLV